MFRITHRTIRRRAVVAATLAAGVALLAGCGGNGTGHDNGHDGGDSSSATQSGTFNDADVAFATGMIPHHRQAVEMANLAPTRASSAEVKALALKIKQAQGPEITQMAGWLQAWGKPVPAAGDSHDDHDGGDAPGMATAADMTKLRAASGATFDRMFLEMMIRHHEGAVAMADKERNDGLHTEAKKVAADIATSQAAEITTMRNLLNKL